MHYERTIHEIALAHLGLVPHAVAGERGIPEHVVRRLRSIGVLEGVHRGISRLVGAAPSFDQTVLAAILAAGPGAAVSHRTAARLHGLSSEHHTDLIDLTVPRSRRPRLDGVMLHRSLDLAPDHVRLVGQLPVTTVERTLADLGDVVHRRQVAWAMERAVIDRLTTIDRLWHVLDDLGRQGRNGRGALREALESWLFDGRPPDSVLEVIFARLCRDHGLALPEFQVEIPADGTVMRVDALWRAARLVAEVDGLHAHATAGQLQSDLRRQNRLVALGYRVLRFTWHDVVQRPTGVAVSIERELGRHVA